MDREKDGLGSLREGRNNGREEKTEKIYTTKIKDPHDKTKKYPYNKKQGRFTHEKDKVKKHLKKQYKAKENKIKIT